MAESTPSGNHHLKMVFFDCGGTLETLIQNDELSLVACRHMLPVIRDAGAKVELTPYELLSQAQEGFRRYYTERRITQKEMIPADIWRKYIFDRQIREDLSFADIIEAVGEELAFIWDSKGYERIMRPDVPDALAKIKERGFRMGIISNVFSTHQVYHDLARFGITSFFDPVVLSASCRLRKPASPIFHLAAELAGVSPAQCLYVGDSLLNDVGGAKKAGFGRAVWLEAPFTEPSDDDTTGVTPDAVISSLSELTGVLD